jgi:hypothetical protein
MPPAPASSNTSISRGPTPSSAAAASTTCASLGAQLARENAGRTPTSSCRCRIPACRRPSATRRLGHSVRARHHPQSLCRPHLHRADAIDPRTRRAHEALRQPRVIEGKRIVLIDDSLVRGTTSKKIVQHDARRRREARCTSASPRRRSRIPTIYGIDTPERDKLLAAHPRLEGDARLSSARTVARLPVGRRHLSRDGLRRPRPERTAVHRSLLHRRLSDATSPTRRGESGRGSCRCWPRRAS